MGTTQATTRTKGFATGFTLDRVIRVRQLTEKNLLHVFDCIKEDGVFEEDALALINHTLSSKTGVTRQINVLTAVLTSVKLWDDSITATPAALPTFKIQKIIDDYLYPQDRLNRVIPDLAPTQDRVMVTTVVDGGSLVFNLGSAYVAGSVTATGLSVAPIESDPAAGEITFDVADDLVETVVTFITAPLYRVFQIERTHERAVGDVQSMGEGTRGFLMHPDVAATLSISLPTIP